MLIRTRNKIEYVLKNTFVGWQTKRQIIVLESDDWGTVRMSSRDSYQKLLSFGIPVDKIHYTKYDALESESDLQSLFETLSKYKDSTGRPPVLTANCLMANPDFKRIKDNDFRHYYFQPVQETFSNYPNHENSFKLWKEGYKNRIFHPQFHGREHVNVNRWMKALRANLVETRLAFEHGVFGISMHGSNEKRKSYMEALAAETGEEAAQIHEIVAEGLAMFRSSFGYPSASFIAPNYTWSSDLERTLLRNDVKFIQGNKMQAEPLLQINGGVFRKVHYTGKRNELGQIYLVRNCHFEPSSAPKNDWVGECLKRIDKAFRSNRPAIVSSHRVNFIGYLDEKNRNENLRLLAVLLKTILSRWPEVEFLSTDELGELIQKNNK